MANKFKNNSGAYFLNALFYEKSPDKETVLYTLKDEDHEGFPSLYKLYMQEDDILEYSFATKYFDSWKHWLLVCECEWFKEHIARWRKEIELKIRTRSLQWLLTDAKTDSRTAAQSNRYLLERGWDLDKKHTKGRPSKEQVKAEVRKQAETQKQINTDYQRIISIDSFTGKAPQ